MIEILNKCMQEGFYYKRNGNIYSVGNKQNVYICRSGLILEVDNNRFYFNKKDYKLFWSDRKEDLINGN